MLRLQSAALVVKILPDLRAHGANLDTTPQPAQNIAPSTVMIDATPGMYVSVGANTDD